MLVERRGRRADGDEAIAQPLDAVLSNDAKEKAFNHRHH